MDRMTRMSSANPGLGPQRYERSPASHASTSRSIETRVTSGHSDTSGSPGSAQLPSLERLPSNETIEARDSASIYDRDLPAPPDTQTPERPFSSATRDAEELVAAYSSQSQDQGIPASEQRREDDPYDGIADDEETEEGTIESAGGGLMTASSAQQPPSPPVNGLTIAVPAVPRKDDSSMAIRKPLRSVSHDARDAKRSAGSLPSP